jgi:hypothetical protein
VGASRLARLLVPIALAVALAACDDRGEDDASPPASADTRATCYGELAGFAGGPVCTAGGLGGDAICYKVNGGATVTVAEPAYDVFGYLHTPDSGDVRTRIGLTMDGGPGANSDGIALYVEAGAGQTGTFDLGRFSSHSRANNADYRAIGSDQGCGRTQIGTYNPVGGTLAGQFEAILCPYNGTTHVVTCGSGEVHLQGAFDVTRGADVVGGSGTPFRAEHATAAERIPREP